MFVHFLSDILTKIMRPLFTTFISDLGICISALKYPVVPKGKSLALTLLFHYCHFKPFIIILY